MYAFEPLNWDVKVISYQFTETIISATIQSSEKINCKMAVLRDFERAYENVPHFAVVHLLHRTKSSDGV